MKALGLDLGTTSLSAVVLETDSGVLAAKTVQNAAFLPGERWERTQNVEEIYAAALPLVQELVCEHPEICATYDMDREQAIKTRKQFLQYAKENHLTIAGMHLPAPAFIEYP